MQKTSLLIYSGGMDSTTLLHQYKDKIGLAVSFDYGSKHNKREIGFAKQNCIRLGVKHIVLDVTSVTKFFKSSLLIDGGKIPEGHYSADNMKSTVVPFRNGIMLSIAAGIAESNDLTEILVASHYGDDAQYPDCRVGFVKPMSQAIKEGTGNEVKMLAPYTLLDKRHIAVIGNNLGIDWSTTWSCYNGGKNHCGKCGTCVERIWALQGFEDNSVYDDYDYAVNLLKNKGEWYEE